MSVRKRICNLLPSLMILVVLLTGCNLGAAPAPTLDVNAINTAVVGTTIAQLSGQMTQTALVAPTTTPAATDTPATLPTFPQSAGTDTIPTFESVPTTEVNAFPTISLNATPSSNLTPVAGFTQLATSAPAGSSGIGDTASGCNDASFISETVPDGTEIKAGKSFTKAWQLQNTGTCTWDDNYMFVFLVDKSSSAIKGYSIAIKSSDEYTKPGHSQSFIVKLVAPTEPGEYKAYWKLQADNQTFFGPLIYLDIVVK